MPTILDNCRPSDVVWFPYPSIERCHPFESWSTYRIYNRLFPARSEFVGGWDSLEDNTAYRINAAQVINGDVEVEDVWKSFVRSHVDRGWFCKVIEVLGFAIESRYDIDELLRPEFTVGVRGTGDYDISLDCQFVINSPSSGMRTVRDPHVDNPIELFAILWYLPEPNDDAGGDLKLYGWRENVSKRFHRSEYGKGSVNPDDVNCYRSVPYRHDQMVMFLNTEDSVHGVTIRKKTHLCRRYVNIIAEVRKPLFKLSQ